VPEVERAACPLSRCFSGKGLGGYCEEWVGHGTRKEKGEADSNVLDLMEAAERLEAVAASLEQAAARIAEREATVQEQVGRIVATVEESASGATTLREQELERRLAEAEDRIAQLTAAHAPTVVQPGGRKTMAAGTASLLAKQGVSVDAGGAAMDAAALDGALATLSIEQRIAVKAELMRAGLLG
jgi:undecaprenyl pyrophosphate synthase